MNVFRTKVDPLQSTIFAAALILLCAASTQAQRHVDLAQDAQGVPQVAYRGVPAAPGYAAVSSSGAGQLSVYGAKPGIDVRDCGVDSTGTNDAAAILNSHTNVKDGISGQTITIPPGCILNLKSGQWQVYAN